ncbi:hypothetical protein ACOMHN_055668 [Nucella lapillus]
MAECRPDDLPVGYLGEQPKYSELGMECVSHKQPEFTLLQDNEVEIKFRVPVAIKTACNLIQVRTEKEFPEYVFSQTDGDKVSFVISFPEMGWYKFQIFALPTTDGSKTLPNVYNYLVDVRRALKAVYAYPKQFAPWRNGCFLHNPLIMNSSTKLHNVCFKVSVPNATNVAVVAKEDWTHLKKGPGNIWEGCVSLDQHRNKNVKVTLNASFDEEESKFSTLLEYFV